MFERLGVVRQRAHMTGFPQGQQALSQSRQDPHSSDENSATQSTFGSPITSLGFNPLSDGAPGENTHQPTHDKLTTEPAKDHFCKDIGAFYLLHDWASWFCHLSVSLFVLLSSVIFS